MSEIKPLGLFDRTLLLILVSFFLCVVLVISFFFPAIFVWVIFNSLVLFGILFYIILFLAHHTNGRAFPPKSFPSVSIIVPTFNSKNTIVACIASIKKVEYPKKVKIIVVDDCCTDGTSEILKSIKGITLIKMKKNSGYSAAFNTALLRVKSEFVIGIDSDSYPETDLLMKSLGYFEDESVAAVTCLVLPDKKKTILQKIQFFEYISSFGLNNAMLSSINSSHVTPGPMTIFRKKVFDKVGSFEEGNLTQDTEFGLRLKKHGLKIMTCVDTCVFTDIPNSWQNLFKQRDRWSRGGVFNFIRYRSLMFNKKNPDFGFFVMPFLFFTQVLTVAILIRMVIFFLADFYNLVLVVFGFLILGGRINFALPIGIIPPSLIFFVMTYVLIAVYFGISFVFVKRFPSIRDLPILVMLIFIYPYFTIFIYSQGYFKEMLGVRAKWVRVST
ncbi:MAG: glycosyltransferase family 2 protein [Candidatus Diapherotrites archaeon]|nr:glycosyltransferase family 2 protein [Candidatus Diapherotrites archaeon]